MPLCPLLNFIPPPSVLKDKTNYSHHPWEKTIKGIYSDKIKGAHNSIRNAIYPKPKEDHDVRIKFTVVGVRTSKEFIYCVHLVKGMHKYRTKTFDVPEIRGVSTTDWPSTCNELKIMYSGIVFNLTSPVIILKDGEFFGGDKELKEFMESRYIYRLCLDYRKLAMEEFSRYVKSTGRPFAYMHISINENYIGTLIFMLYSDIVPNTCENFLRLCKTRRGGYSGTPVHRIVEDSWIQCGGFALKDTKMTCENFIVPHDRRGVLGMCNDARDVNCSTQFFVLLQPCPWMKHKYVAFGQLVDGEETLKKIENVPTYYEAPISSIIINRAGILNLDCEDITINKRTREYINNHIEDLIELEEFFIELLMQRVWAAIEARQKEKKLIEEEIELELESSEKSGWRRPGSRASAPFSNETKENQEFAAESYVMFEAEEHQSEVNTKRTPVKAIKPIKPIKPFYMPLTDVSYPGEVDSTFDLKKFLKGDYCLESDLQEDLPKDENQRVVQKIVSANLPSDLFLFDEDNYIKIDDVSIDSDEEEEIQNYIKNYADKVSFAGETVRNITTVREGHAMFNIFEGKRKSELPFVTDDDLKMLRRISILERRQSRRYSERVNFTDEDMRKLRHASAIERGPVNLYYRRHSVRKASTTQPPIELPKLIDIDKQERAGTTIIPLPQEAMKRLRRASRPILDRTSMTSEESKESTEDKALPKIEDSVKVRKRQKSTFERRQSVFDPVKSRSATPDHVEGLRKSQIEKLRRISMFDVDSKLHEDKLRTSSTNKEQFDKKRRQTVFAKDIAKVQNYQRDRESDSPSISEFFPQQKSIRFPSGTEEAHKEIKRRQTGYVHEQDLEKLHLDLEDHFGSLTVSEVPSEIAAKSADEIKQLEIKEGGAVKLAIPVSGKDPETIERRQTGFVRATPSMLEFDDDDDDAEIAQNSTISPTLPLLDDGSSKNRRSFEHGNKFEYDRKSSDNRNAEFKRTFKSPKAVEEENFNKVANLRESVFAEIFKDKFAKRDSAPTLKNYKPISDSTGTKNMFLAFGRGTHIDVDRLPSPHLRRSQTIESDLSFVNMSKMKFGRKSLPMMSKNVDKIATKEAQNPLIATRAVKSHTKQSKGPSISVEEYQRKNRERLEKLKKTESRRKN